MRSEFLEMQKAAGKKLTAKIDNRREQQVVFKFQAT